MKVVVKEVFIDKFDNSKVYEVGDVIDIPDNDRVADLTNGKLVEVAEMATDEKPKKTATKRKAKE